MANELKNYIEILEGLDIDDFKQKLEREAERFENQFIGLFAEDSKIESGAPKVPVFDFSPSF